MIDSLVRKSDPWVLTNLSEQDSDPRRPWSGPPLPSGRLISGVKNTSNSVSLLFQQLEESLYLTRGKLKRTGVPLLPVFFSGVSRRFSQKHCRDGDGRVETGWSGSSHYEGRR